MKIFIYGLQLVVLSYIFFKQKSFLSADDWFGCNSFLSTFFSLAYLLFDSLN